MYNFLSFCTVSLLPSSKIVFRYCYLMFICSVCSFSSTKRRDWERHASYLGHTLSTRPDDDDEEAHNLAFVDAEMESSEDSFEQVPAENPHPNILFDTGLHVSPQPGGSDSNGPSPQDNSNEEDENQWFPFLSKAHFYLTVLYHGSHRR